MDLRPGTLWCWLLFDIISATYIIAALLLPMQEVNLGDSVILGLPGTVRCTGGEFG